MEDIYTEILDVVNKYSRQTSEKTNDILIDNNMLSECLPKQLFETLYDFQYENCVMLYYNYRIIIKQ